MRYPTALFLAGWLILALGCTTPYGTEPSSPSDPPSAPPSEPTTYPRPEPAPEPTVSSDDQEIHDQVHDALYRNLGDEASDILVTVEDGQVYLAGCVDSERQHDRAHDLAHEVRGVESVNHRELEVC